MSISDKTFLVCHMPLIMRLFTFISLHVFAPFLTVHVIQPQIVLRISRYSLLHSCHKLLELLLDLTVLDAASV